MSTYLDKLKKKKNALCAISIKFHKIITKHIIFYSVVYRVSIFSESNVIFKD